MSDSLKPLAGMAIAAVAAAAALGACWAVDAVCGSVALGTRWCIWGVAVAAATGLTFVVGQRMLNRQAELRQSIENLCRLDLANDLADGEDANRFNLADDDPWRATLGAIEAALRSQGQRLGDAEDARALAEVRARRLSVERDRLAQIVGQLPQPIIAVNAFQELIFLNAPAAKLFGSPELAEERRPIGTLACPALAELLRDTCRRKPPYQRTTDLDWTGRDGKPHSYSILLRAVEPSAESQQEDSRRAHGAIAVVHDHSQVKAIQQRNAEFVAAVSHEMKTPLAGIKAYVELLADGEAEDADTRNEFLGIIDGQADRLKRLVENLLNIARIEAGVVHVDKQPHSLNAILEEALRVVRPAAEQKSIALAADLSELYLGVSADRDMLLQAAINLLSNAVKYTHPNGAVILRSRLKDDAVLFEVEDNGVGLSPEDCQRVFERFYRVKKDKDMAAGTGLGLPLAKHIVEDVHGGSLTLSSVLGQGSTFCVTLPHLARSADRASEARSPALARMEH